MRRIMSWVSLAGGLLLSMIARGDGVADLVANVEMTKGRFDSATTNIVLGVAFTPQEGVDTEILLAKLQEEYSAKFYVARTPDAATFEESANIDYVSVAYRSVEGQVNAEITLLITSDELMQHDFLFRVIFTSTGDVVAPVNMGRFRRIQHANGTTDHIVMLGDYDEIVLERIVRADEWMSGQHLLIGNGFVVRFEYDLNEINNAFWGEGRNQRFQVVVVNEDFMATTLVPPMPLSNSHGVDSFDWDIVGWNPGEYVIGLLPEEYMRNGQIDKDMLGVVNLHELSSYGFLAVTISDVALHEVSFDIQDGIMSDGGELEQIVVDGQSAVAPKVVASGGRTVFLEWDKPFSCVTNDLVVTAQYRVIPDDVIVHSGIVSSNEIWRSDFMHLVVADVQIASNASVIIERNAVVKFMPSTEMRIDAGGKCDAQGVIFTHVNDDTVGGDLFGDGDATQPRDSEYSIRGILTDDSATEYRYRMLTVDIADLRFRQRYPWNGLVDIDLSVNCSNPTTNIILYVNAKDEATGKALVVRNVWLENDASHTNTLEVRSGTHRLIWDAGKDNSGLVSEAVTVEVMACIGTYVPDESCLYMVVDVSAGPNAVGYPVSYLDKEPQGGWTDEYKSSKIVLRRVSGGTFMMGSENGTDIYGRAGTHKVTISKPFYIGIFEITRKQCSLIEGYVPEVFAYNGTSARYYGDGNEDLMPALFGSVAEFRDNYDWPSDRGVGVNSLMGLLRLKTGLAFDLPTEAQWEYVCRAGTTTDALNASGNFISTGAYSYTNQVVMVGSFVPNDWGLHDMYGNVDEWCLDWFAEYPSEPVIDPVGPDAGEILPPHGTSAECPERVRRGGSCWWAPSAPNSFRIVDWGSVYGAGGRFCCNITIPEAATGNSNTRMNCLGRLDLRKGTRFASDVEKIAYSPRWGNAENCTVIADGDIIKTATEDGEFEWTPAGSGAHTLTHTAGDLTYTAQFTVLGDDVAVHRGTIELPETWGTDKIHLVAADVTVPNGVSLLIEPGAVVKFMPGTSLVVKEGATCRAIGVVFTHANDDTLQGDTLCDGETAPVLDDYKITGNVIDDDTTEYRYMAPQELTSSVTSNIRLRGHRVYVVSNDVTVVNGAALTIQPGAILKFASGKSLTVNSGGTLNAQGTRALPIVFTSIKDDTVGGDTNGDADATHAESGDWARIYVSGSAKMDYCTIRYCNNNSDYGAIQGRDSGSVTFDNGMIEYSVYECVRMGSSSRFVAHNSVLRESSMGFGYYGGSGTYAYNCIVADCTVGCRARNKYFYNTIFYNCKSFTDQGGDNSSYRNCLFFNTADKISEGFASSYQKVGANGNAWSNPHFIDPNNGDFRIAADSPCVDAGDVAHAPKTDYFGQRRVTVHGFDGDQESPALPDIGIHEVMPRDVTSDMDLAVESVSAPETMVVGGEATVSWTVKNVGSETASGTWSDRVELVCANGSAVELGTVTTSATIPADGVQTFSGTFTVPSAQVGAVRVRVTANANRDIFEGTLTANNAAESNPATLTMPELAFPASGVASFSLAAGGSVGYRLGKDFEDGGLLVVQVNGGQGSGRPTGVNIWTGNGQVPTADIFYAAAVDVGGGRYIVRVPAGSEAYVSFANGGGGPATIEADAETGAFLLFDTGVVTAPNAGSVSLTLFGNGFEDGMDVWITNGRDGARPSQEVVVFDPVKAVATFDVTGLAAGEYEVHVKKGNAEGSAPLLALTETRVGPQWSCRLDVASSVRTSREYVGYLEYANTGDMPLDAPYVKITAGSGSFIRFGASDAWGDTLELMAISETYPVSQLKPGETRRIPFRYKTTSSSLSIECGYTQEDATAFPWDTNAAYMRPPWASDELWGLALAVLKANVGMTWNAYLARMRTNCDHLAKIGQPTHRLDRIWQLEINEALGVDHAISTLASNTDLARSGRGFGLALSRSYGSGLYRRLRKGIFGYGWSDNYSAYAELQNSGATLALHSGSGSTYLFEKVNGTWTPEDARDKTTCTESSSEYVLTYRSGTVQRIAKSNMRVSSVTDNQGNSLAFTYNAATQLVNVAHCDGQSLSFTYAGGLLVSATDDQGRTTHYEYSGDLLVKVTAFNGLSTQYRYLPADGSVTSRALRQIAYADGTTRDYTYDGAGRVATVSINGNLQTVEIERGALGSYAVIAPNGGTTTVTLGASGEVLETSDAKGNRVYCTYTVDTLLEAVVGPTGKRAKIAYDEDGQAVKATDAAGADTHFGYTSDFGNLAKVTDARGNSFDYGYDKKGCPKSISYADGSIESIAYNDRGDVTNSVNRRGQSIAFTYDREGNTLSKVWDDGRTFTWAYDAKGNCTNATDSATGTVTMEYDENERLVRIVHPKGRGFAYTYDSLGRTISRTTLGRAASPLAADVQKYTYDSLGRLSRMTDGDGNLYVENHYDDTTGWLITQTYGNGTVVSNAYDILGRTIGIYHGRAGTPCPPWLAFFEYAYDAEGRRISQTTAEGVECYTYDTVGQLTDVIYPDGSEEHFSYDAVGNRITSGRVASPLAVTTTTTYIANNLNQYTSAGAATFTYDLNGNLTSKTSPAGGTTLYYYDIQNRLVAVTNETKDIHWSCEYDVFGNRTKVVDHGTAKEMLFVPGSLASAVAEYDASGSPTTRHILLGSVRLADITGTTGVSPVETRYYHADGLASTRLLTDANGDIAGTASYRAFGEVRAAFGVITSAGWVGILGVERDNANGLVFMRNRYYDIGVGRFVSSDPIGLDGLDVNSYRYCNNSPVSEIDPDGCVPTLFCLEVNGPMPATITMASEPWYVQLGRLVPRVNAPKPLPPQVDKVGRGIDLFKQGKLAPGGELGPGGSGGGFSTTAGMTGVTIYNANMPRGFKKDPSGNRYYNEESGEEYIFSDKSGILKTYHNRKTGVWGRYNYYKDEWTWGIEA